MARRHPNPTLLPLLLAASFLLLARAEEYNPRNVDWSSVVDACAAVMRFERRLASFALRSSFHDAGSLTPQCAATTNSPTCGGADGSLMVSADEQLHPNNRDELFASNTARFVLPIAKQYGASVADTLYVCALVAPAILAYPASMVNGPTARAVRADPVLNSAVAAGFKVGRLDRTTSGPQGNDPSLLPMATLTLTEFKEWFETRGVSLQDAAALLGVHTLLRPKGCYVEDRIDLRTGQPRGCVPFVPSAPGPGQPSLMPSDNGPFTIAKGSCPMVSMMRWSNEWFNDLCGTKGEGAPFFSSAPAPAQQLSKGQKGFAQQVADSVCGYRSDAFRADAVQRQLEGKFLTSPAASTPTVIEWQCPSTGPCRSNPRTWFFTENDAHLSSACRAGALLPSSSSPVAAAPAAAALMQSATLNPSAADDVALVKALRASFLEYSGGLGGLQQWALDFGTAYARMSSLGAQWSTAAFVPTLLECRSGWIHLTADTPKNQQMCTKRCANALQQAYTGGCPDACRCASAPRVLRVDVVPATGPVTSAP